MAGGTGSGSSSGSSFAGALGDALTQGAVKIIDAKTSAVAQQAAAPAPARGTPQAVLNTKTIAGGAGTLILIVIAAVVLLGLARRRGG